jgi:hypothetical protein
MLFFHFVIEFNIKIVFPKNTKSPPEIKDFNVTLYIITPIDVDEIRSLMRYGITA